MSRKTCEFIPSTNLNPDRLDGAGVKAWVVGPFCVHRMPMPVNDRGCDWQLSHQASGFRVCGDRGCGLTSTKRKRVLMRFAESLANAPGMDWASSDPAEILRRCAAATPPINGATLRADLLRCRETVGAS